MTARATDNLGAVTMSANSPTVTVTSTTTTTVVLQRGLAGYAGVGDTFLNSTATTGAYGAFNPLYLNSTLYLPLLRFAVFQSEGGPVPDGVAIQSAKLGVYKGYYDNTLRLNALLKPWVEAQATWNQSQTGVPWSVAGAAGAGTDYDTNTDALVSVGFNPGWVAFDVTPRVQKWSSKTIANYGWRLTPTTASANNITFSSSEYTTDPTLRPKLTVVYGQAPANTPPTVMLTGPADGSSTALGGSFALTATAGDVDGTVAKVEFLANGSVIGQSTSAPYGMTWTPAAVGSYVLTARATDNLGAVTTSANSATVTVNPGSNTPPTVTLTGPADGSSTALGGSFALTATAGDVDGTVSQVEFLANGSVVGQSTSAPYGMTWTPATVGSYVLTARATDNLGAVTMSANSATVTVTSTTTTTVVLQRGLTGYAGVGDTFLNSTATTGAYGAFNPLYSTARSTCRCCASRCSSPRADRCRTAWRSSRRSWSSTRATTTTRCG